MPGTSTELNLAPNRGDAPAGAAAWAVRLLLWVRRRLGITVWTERLGRALALLAPLRYEPLACCAAHAAAAGSLGGDASPSHSCTLVRLVRVVAADPRLGLTLELSGGRPFGAPLPPSPRPDDDDDDDDDDDGRDGEAADASTSHAPYHCLSYTWGDPFAVEDDDTDTLRFPHPRGRKSAPQRALIGLGVPDLGVVSGVRRAVSGVLGSLGGGAARRRRPALYTVICNGRLVAVRANLWDCLMSRAVAGREPAQLSALFADALCINQADAAEKAGQVLQMHRIYGGAASVLVWLGPDREDMALVRTAVDGVAALVAASAGSADGDVAFDDDELWRRVRDSSSGNGDDEIARLLPYDALREAELFLHRSYWHRTWIFQEVVCARRLVVASGGGEALAWEDVVRLSTAVTLFGGLRRVGLGRLDGTDAPRPTTGRRRGQPEYFDFWRRKYLASGGLGPHFGDFVLVGNRDILRCGVAHDVLYAHRGVCEREDLPVDYGKPVSQVYTEFWAGVLARPGVAGSLDRLHAVEDASVSRHRGVVETWVVGDGKGGPDDARFALPSWVPDFHAPHSPESILQHYGDNGRTFFSLLAGDGRPVADARLPRDCIRVRGVHVETVAAVSETEDDLWRSNLFPDLLGLLETSLRSGRPSPYATAADKVRAFYTTMNVQAEDGYNDTAEWPVPDRGGAELKDWMRHCLATWLLGHRKVLWSLAWSPALVRHVGLSSLGPGRVTAPAYGPLARMYEGLDAADAAAVNAAVPRPEELAAYAVAHDDWFSARKAAQARGEAVPPMPLGRIELEKKQGSGASTPFVGMLNSGFGQRSLSYRRAFLGSKGYMGKGPRSLMPGDEIWVVAGTKVPFVLRKSSRRVPGVQLRSYTFVGMAYVHGVMDLEDRKWTEALKYLEDLILV